MTRVASSPMFVCACAIALSIGAHAATVPGAARHDGRQAPAPTPKPFPRPADTPRQTPSPTSTPQTPARPAAAPAQPAAPTEAMLGVPIAQGAQFIASYDAGMGQRYYLFGAAAS